MKMKRILFCIIMIVLTAFDLAVLIKGAIGIGAYDAFAKTTNVLTGIKVGTVGMICNVTCVLIQLAFLRKKANISHLLQIPMNILIGMLVNFFYYNVLGEQPFGNYALTVVLVIIAYALNAFFAAAMLLTGVITFSLEGACKVVADHLGKEFHHVRMAVDIICIAFCIGATLLAKVPLTIREGTILGMIAFGPVLGLYTKYTKPVLVRFGLADE